MPRWRAPRAAGPAAEAAGRRDPRRLDRAVTGCRGRRPPRGSHRHLVGHRGVLALTDPRDLPELVDRREAAVGRAPVDDPLGEDRTDTVERLELDGGRRVEVE